jgi:hypothetical protein
VLRKKRVLLPPCASGDTNRPVTRPAGMVAARRATVILLLLSFASTGSDREAYREMERNIWLADSSRYASRLTRWVHDSTVIDSIARTIPTDSLRSLYRLATSSKQALPIFTAITCERLRLVGTYGTAATQVSDLVDSTAWTPAERAAFESRLPEHLFVDEKQCGPYDRSVPVRVVSGTKVFDPLGRRPHLRPKPE